MLIWKAVCTYNWQNTHPPKSDCNTMQSINCANIMVSYHLKFYFITSRTLNVRRTMLHKLTLLFQSLDNLILYDFSVEFILRYISSQLIICILKYWHSKAIQNFQAWLQMKSDRSFQLSSVKKQNLVPEASFNNFFPFIISNMMETSCISLSSLTFLF